MSPITNLFSNRIIIPDITLDKEEEDNKIENKAESIIYNDVYKKLNDLMDKESFAANVTAKLTNPKLTINECKSIPNTSRTAKKIINTTIYLKILFNVTRDDEVIEFSSTNL